MSIKGIYINPNCDRTLPLSLHSCGIGRFEKNFCHGPNIRDEFVIHYVTDGEGWLETPNGTFKFGAGDIFCIYPGEIIKYRTEETKCYFAFVNFVGKEAEKTYSTIGITHQTPVIHIDRQPIVETVQQCMYHLKNSSTPSQMRLTGFLLETLSNMETVQTKQSAKLKDSCTDKGMAYMEYYFNENISMDDIAAAAGVERSYFYRVFKQRTGISPIEYLTKLRIKKARELIAMDVDFKTVAAAVGINDVYYFSKLFKKSQGITPSAYRKSLKGNREQ